MMPNNERIRTTTASPAPNSASIDRLLMQLLARIDSLLDEEADLLASANLGGLEQLIDRKDHLALEASRVVQMAQGYMPVPEVTASLGNTLKKLSSQAEQVRRHVDAVKTIAAMISDLHSEASGDGTYDNLAHRKAGNR
jgi:hypothetical protein